VITLAEPKMIGVTKERARPASSTGRTSRAFGNSVRVVAYAAASLLSSAKAGRATCTPPGSCFVTGSITRWGCCPVSSSCWIACDRKCPASAAMSAFDGVPDFFTTGMWLPAPHAPGAIRRL
jgi:hypothetical protein